MFSYYENLLPGTTRRDFKFFSQSKLRSSAAKPACVYNSHLAGNDLLASDEELNKLHLYALTHSFADQKIPADSPFNAHAKNRGALLFSVRKGTVYKLFSPDTPQDKRESLWIQSLDSEKLSTGTLGKGGFGKVKICQDLTTGQFYCVKILRKDNLSTFLGWVTQSSLTLFNFAIPIAAMEKVGLYDDHLVTQDKIYIVQKIVPGQNLTTILLSGYFYEDSEIRLLEVFQKMISALGDVHRHKIIHGDVAPENFMFDIVSGKIALVDFDFATLNTANSDNVANWTAGKPGHMAPELYYSWRGWKPTPLCSYYSYASDVYALGFSFQRMLNFFQKENIFLSERVQNEITGLIADMCHKDPAQRPTLTECFERLPHPEVSSCTITVSNTLL